MQRMPIAQFGMRYVNTDTNTYRVRGSEQIGQNDAIVECVDVGTKWLDVCPVIRPVGRSFGRYIQRVNSTIKIIIAKQFSIPTIYLQHLVR